MSTIWLGLVGPGVARRGVDSTTWADQTDSRPTILALTGLHDDYNVDGRVLLEDLTPRSLPAALRVDQDAVLRLGETYKQIEAVQGRFGLATLAASTKGLLAGDPAYQLTEQQLSELDSQRDALAGEIQNSLLGAEFRGGRSGVGKPTG